MFYLGVTNKDNGSGLQQFIIEKLPPNYSGGTAHSKYKISIVGTVPSPYNVGKYLCSSSAKTLFLTTLTNVQQQSHMYGRFAFVSIANTNKYYFSPDNIPSETYPENIQTQILIDRNYFPYKDRSVSLVGYDDNPFTPTNPDLHAWEIQPVDVFQIEKIEYYMNPGDRIEQIPDYFTTATVTNNTSLEQGMTMHFGQKATEQSTFSETEGMSLTISQNAGFSIASIVSGGIDMTSVTTNTFSFTKSESKEDTRSYDFPIRVAPYKKVDATAAVQRYTANITYVATFKGTRTNKIIKLSGKWEGIQAGNITYTLTESSTGRILSTFTGIPTQTVDLTK